MSMSCRVVPDFRPAGYSDGWIPDIRSDIRRSNIHKIVDIVRNYNNFFLNNREN